MATELKTGVGRIVWGNPAKATIKKDTKTKQPILRDGNQVQQWVFGVAFPKAEFQATIWPIMAAEAATGYPNGVPPRFSWKYVDGDGVDSAGQLYSNREGYAGCFVLTVSTEAFAPKIAKFNPQSGQYAQVPLEGIKTGDYVVLGLNLKVNVPTDPTHTPGMYVNPLIIEHVGYGSEIVSANAVDPNQFLGGATYALPPGASATPLAPVAPVGAPGMPVAPGQPMQPVMTPPAPGQPMQPVMTPPAPPAPPVGPQRPVDPSHIAPNPAGGEFWFNVQLNAWEPAPAAPAPIPPAHDFVQNAGMPMQPVAGMPGMPMQPVAGMPGMPMQPVAGMPGMPNQFPGAMPGR